jgi:glycosyltransferase involved in cell wall biosynthesis
VRIALVHDWLLTRGGAERVMEAIWDQYPDAELFTVLYDPKALPAYRQQAIVRQTWISRLPQARRRYQRYLPLMTWAIEDLDLSAYDLVLSDCSAVSKGVITRAGTVHVSYIHSPMRYAWDLYAQYRAHEATPVERRLMSPIFSYLRRWDYVAAQRPDVLVANSTAVQRRIWKHYRRPSTVVHPPVNVERFPLPSDPGTYWLVLSRLVSYKRFDLAVEACNRLRLPLTVAGDGPERARLQRLAGPTVKFVGRVSDDEAVRLLSGCRGLVFPGEEDFGIVLVEAQACGRPVVAYGRGGAEDTVRPDQTGILFPEQSVDAVIDALQRAEQRDWDAAALRAHAAQFGVERFRTAFRAVVDSALAGGRDPQS